MKTTTKNVQTKKTNKLKVIITEVQTKKLIKNLQDEREKRKEN
jgi:hypothetical protein